MNHEGPALERLLRRLAETPSDFLAEPRSHSQRRPVRVSAVVADVFAAYGQPLPDLAAFESDDSLGSKRRAGLVLLLCWFLAEPELLGLDPPAHRLHDLLANGATDLAGHLAAEKYVADPERREELVRFALARLDLRPRGESVAHAQDRLSALGTAERVRVIAASKQAELRARQVREALVRKAAQESADKYTRE